MCGAGYTVGTASTRVPASACELCACRAIIGVKSEFKHRRDLKLGHNCTLSRLCFCFPHCLAGTRKQARAASLAPRARGNWHANSQLAARRRRPRGRSSLIGLDKKTTWIVLSSQVCSRGSTPPAGCSLRCSVVITGFSARASTSMFEGQPLRASSWLRGGGGNVSFFCFSGIASNLLAK